jgi:hypothetical protein
MRRRAKQATEMNATRTMNRIETMGGAMAVSQSSVRRRFGQVLWPAVAALVGALCLLALAGNAKAAPYGIETAGVELSTSQAGAHPDLKLDFELTKSEETGRPEFGTKKVVTDMPAGLVGNVTNFATCDMADVIRTTNTNSNENYSACPRSSNVGYMDITVRYAYANLGFMLRQRVYRLPSDPGEPAAFGTSVFSQPIRLTVGVRSGSDYGIRVTADKLPEQVLTLAVSAIFWGVPADHQGGGATAPMFDGNPTYQTEPTNAEQYFGNPLVGVARTPLLTNPTSCTGQELVTGLGVASWAEPENLISTGLPSPRIIGCEQVAFDPAISVKPDSRRAGQPSGVQVDLKVPQTNDANQLATSHLKDATVTLPKGVTLSPALAEGLVGCTDEELGLYSEAPEACPPASKLGTVQLETPLLEEPMTGSIYVGSQESNDPQSGQMYRMFLTAEGAGVLVKLAGQIKVDPQTGQITTVFENNPQLPFSDLALKFKGGDHAPLVLPQSCGEYRTTAQLTGWANPGAPVETWSSFKVDENCDAASQFTPGFAAGTTNPIGGSFSPFTLRVTRPDGQQDVSTIAATLPEGVLAKLAGVPLCGDAEAATGNCPASSQVGSVTIGTGAGSDPLYVPQPGKAPTAVYLAGPYKGAPYSLVAKVPAQAGPFDLGTVAVRNTIAIDPTTTQVSVQSDPLPQVLGGIPISYRDIQVDVDRSDFTLNPTSCDPTEIKGTIGSSAGTTVDVSDRFQVASCEALGFHPKLALRLSGAPPRRGGNPALQATLTPPQGDANIGGAAVVLPATELLEQGHIRTVCTRVQFAANQCPAGSIYGSARVWTPLLDAPLEGPVYLRSNGGERKLPDLVADLNGQIHVVLVGYIDSVKRKGAPRIRTRFVSVPDAPVSKFVLNMLGGKKGLLANNTNLCKAKPHAEAALTGQNGKAYESQPLVSVGGCGGKAKGKKRK